MNRAEVARLLAIVQAFDRRTVGETDVLAWADVLGDIDFADAQAAVRAHYRTETRWLMPADVRQLVKAGRDDRLSRHPIEAPDAEITDQARKYLASMRSRIRDVASGWDIRRALPPPEEPSETYRQARPEQDERVAVLAVPCPWPPCRASRGQGCVNALGRPLPRQAAHEARLKAKAALTRRPA